MEQDSDYETVTLRGPSLGVAFLAALGEANLMISEVELNAVSRTNESKRNDQLGVALRKMGALIEDKAPAENNPGRLELRIGQWHFSARDATLRALRSVATKAVGLAATGISTATLVAAIISLVIEFPELISANRLNADELDVLLVLESTDRRDISGISAQLNLSATHIQQILDRLADRKVVSERQGVFAVRW